MSVGKFFVRFIPTEGIDAAMDALLFADGPEWPVVAGWEESLLADVPQVAFRHPEPVEEDVLAEFFDDAGCFVLCHPASMTNQLSSVKIGDALWGQIACQAILRGMGLEDKPFGDIATRLRWHRALTGLTQKDYAAKIGQKRATLNNWEGGDYRLSLDGALALRRTYGLSLDFMYEGNDDALPMTLRNAWRDSPEVIPSK